MQSLLLTPNVSGATPLELIGGEGGVGIWIGKGAEALGLLTPSYQEIYAEGADTEGGRRTRSRPENVKVPLKVFIGGASAAAFHDNLDSWQARIEACRRHGGTLEYTPEGGTPVTYDLESAQITEMPQEGLWQRARVAESTAELTLRPYGRLDPVEIIPEASPESSTEPLLRFDVPEIPGSVEALGRLIFRDGSGQARRWLGWGKGPAADLPAGGHLIDSADLVSAGFSGELATRSGAYGGASDNVIRSTLIPTPLVVCSTGSIAHVGVYRPTLRLYGSGTGPIYVRLAYRLADGPWSRTAWQTPAVLAAFAETAFELIEIERTQLGNQSAEIRVEAYSENPGDTLDVDYLEMMPAESWGKANAPAEISAGSEVIAYDTFLQAAGDLAAAAAPVGGGWDEVNLSTEAPAADFDLSGSPDYRVTRAVADAGGTQIQHGNVAILDGSSAITNLDAQVDITLPTFGTAGEVWAGIVARYVDANNFLIFVMSHFALSASRYLYVWSCEGGSSGSVAQVGFAGAGHSATAKTLRATVDEQGNYALYHGEAGSDLGAAKLSGQASVLASPSGALKQGKIGIFDHATGAPGTLTRAYRNFQATASATADLTGRVLHPNEGLEVRHDGVLRESVDGASSARPRYEGAYLRLAPAIDGGEVILAKARRNDIDAEASANLDDELEATLQVIPRVPLTSGAP